MVRLKISTTSGDTGEATGVTFFRFQSGLGTGVFTWPFSITRVFSVSAGSHRYYFNGWHQVVNGTPSLNNFTLVAHFVPTRY